MVSFDEEAATLISQFPPGPRVAVLGSTGFWGKDSEAICKEIGAQLASIPGLILITGGVSGVGETIGRSFLAHKNENQHIFHILPRRAHTWDYGTVLRGGDSMEDRREILARVSPCYIVVEGGPGTVHEYTVAKSRAVVIPVGRTGESWMYKSCKTEEIGCAGDYFEATPPPPSFDIQQWKSLNDDSQSIENVAQVVTQIVNIFSETK